MSQSKPVTIAPATGTLGVLMPGISAVATTFVAGVHAIKKGVAKPLGSLCSLGSAGLVVETAEPF